MNQHTFVVGEIVTWSEAALRDPALTAVTRYGSGPFVVVEVRAVPDTYASCGTLHDDQDHRERGCPYSGGPHDCRGQSMRGQVGHHQWLVIRRPDSETPLGNFVVSPSQFSGKWFAPKAA